MTKSDHFHAAVVSSSDGEAPQLGHWCPWCEAVHVHGLAGKSATEAMGKTTNRGAHCVPHHSPLAGGGVDLTPDRIVRSSNYLVPPGPFWAVKGDPLETRVRLGAVLEHGQLGLSLLRMVFGKHRSARSFDARLVGGWAQVWASGDTWYVQNERRDTLASGHGVGTLLARLFGLPIGVLAVRVLDDALGLTLSPADRLALADVIDAAASRSNGEARA